MGSFCKHGAALARLFRNQEAEKNHSMREFSFEGQEFLQALMQKKSEFNDLSEYQELISVLAKLLPIPPTSSFNQSGLNTTLNTSTQHDNALRWLNNLRQNLIKLDKNTKSYPVTHQSSPFVYLIEQEFGELQLELIKVRRIKSGEIYQTQDI